jgi:hypothetical protein
MPASTITPELKRDLQLLKVLFAMFMYFVILCEFSLTWCDGSSFVWSDQIVRSLV